MTNNKNKLFPLIEKLLSRANLSESIFPSNIDQWQNFLERINNSFYDFEQERYLLERSMEISSREMVELNERFEMAQSIAHIGYWFYNPSKKQILCSKETYRLLGIDPNEADPSYQNIIDKIFLEDTDRLEALVQLSLETGQDFEYEFRLVNQGGTKPIWLYIKAHPYNEKLSLKESTLILSGIVMDITERKYAQNELDNMNQKLIEFSRKAGMSDIASSILHNVGNVLNSANISISVLDETIAHSKIKNLGKLNKLIRENLPKNPDYFISDSKGKLIPNYLVALSDDLLEEYRKIEIEIQALTKNIHHIKDIVDRQKDISGVHGIEEKVELPNICDLAIQMSIGNSDKLGIAIIKDYQWFDYIKIDKTKLLQILVNLITNAVQALVDKNVDYKKTIIIKIKKIKSDVAIMIEDNGIGIAKRNLIKIFSMGFTTKSKGSGFGLHSSALAAHELHGSLTAESKGVNKGAIFTLTLPIKKLSN